MIITNRNFSLYIIQYEREEIKTQRGADYFVIKKLRSTGSAVCTLPAIPYCQATTVTFTGNLLRGGIGVNTIWSPSISAMYTMKNISKNDVVSLQYLLKNQAQFI